MSTKIRQYVEKVIVHKFVNDALKAGYRLSVSLDRGYDIDEMLVIGSTACKKIMDEAFAGDNCHIFVHSATGELIKDGQLVSIGWVYLVFGNDGGDVISDYTVNLGHLIDGANKLADKYADFIFLMMSHELKDKNNYQVR